MNAGSTPRNAWIALWISVLGALFTQTARAQSTSRATINVLCKFPDVAGEPGRPADVQALVTGPLDAFFRDASYGAINLSGSSTMPYWVTLPRERSYYTSFAALRDACLDLVDAQVYFPSYDIINVWLNDAHGDAHEASAQTLTRDGQTREYGVSKLGPTAFQGWTLAAHEMAHTFWMRPYQGPFGLSRAGIQHSTSAGWDVMSAAGGSDRVGLLAYWRDQAGWIPPERKFVYPGEGDMSILLDRLSDPGPSGYLMAEVPIPGRPYSYTVELRAKTAGDADVPDTAVLIHRVGPSFSGTWAELVTARSGASTRGEDAMWRHRESYLIEEIGVRVYIQFLHAGVVNIKTAAARVIFTPGTLPPPVDGLVAQPLSDTSARLTWNAILASSSAETPAFWLKWRPKALSQQLMTVQEDTASWRQARGTTTYTLQGLVPGELYDVRVRACFMLCSADQVIDVLARGPTGQAPAAPTITRYTIFQTSIGVSWSANSNDVTSFRAQYFARDGWTCGSTALGSIDVGASATNATLTNLSPSTPYCVTVSACNANGCASSPPLYPQTSAL